MEEEKQPEKGLIQRFIEEEMQQSYLDYAMSVIVSRALPDVRDGLKPVHRRILHVMNSNGLRHNAKYRKSARIIGDVMGKYHPHGNLAIYDAMARMAQDFSMRYPLVDGQGNFGSMDNDPPAADRYTEARMTIAAEEILADIDKNTVDFQPNYDGSEKEPKVLPAKLPNLLLNGQMGIAVGMATNIPPHNLGEIVDAIVHLIDNPDATVEDLTQFVKGPDFPTGGEIYNPEEIKAAYGTGKGRVTTRAVAEITEDKKGTPQIIITELPYQVNKANLVIKIAELHRDKKIVGLADLRDESNRDGVKIVVDIKKDAHPNKILNQLYKLTPMQTVFHVNMLALVDNGLQPRVLNLEMILKHYLEHRKEVVTRRTQFELDKAKARAHILEGLRIALDNIDEVIATIKKSKTTEEAKQNLIKKFKLSELQARAILDMRLQTLAGLERQKIEDEYQVLVKLIAELEAILADPKKILEIIRNEVNELKEKYGDRRRTRVMNKSLGIMTDEELVPNEQVIVTITKGSYIKRIVSSTYKSQGRGGKGIIGMTMKEEDVVEHMVLTYNHDTILFFTNKGRAFKLKVHEIPATSRTAKGVSIMNLINLQPDERVTALVTLTKDKKADGQFLMMCTLQGTVKKTKISDYQNVRASGLIAIRLDQGDELKWVKMTAGSDEIIISTTLAQANRFRESEVRPMGRATRGVRGIKLRSGDHVVGMDIAVKGSQLLVVSENGYGKRTPVDQFTTHHRGVMGIKAGVVSTKTGKVIDVRAIGDIKEDLVVVSARGQLIRVPLSSVSKLSRVTQGVRIMKLNSGDRVASLALIGETEVEESIQSEAPETK